MAGKHKSKKPSQSEKFIAAARELGCDEDESAFDEIVKKVAKAAPPRKEGEDPTKHKGQHHTGGRGTGVKG